MDSLRQWQAGAGGIFYPNNLDKSALDLGNVAVIPTTVYHHHTERRFPLLKQWHPGIDKITAADLSLALFV